MLRDSVVVVAAVVRTRPQAIPLAMITMRKSTHGFPFVSYMGMGLRLGAAGSPQKLGRSKEAAAIFLTTALPGYSL